MTGMIFGDIFRPLEPHVYPTLVLVYSYSCKIYIFVYVSFNSLRLPSMCGGECDSVVTAAAAASGDAQQVEEV